MTAEPMLTEGWGVIRPGDRRAHYYTSDGRSLCLRVGFYRGPLDADAFTSKDDCAACRKQLTRRQAKAGTS